MPFDLESLVLDRLGERTIKFCGQSVTLRPLRRGDHDEVWRLRAAPKIIGDAKPTPDIVKRQEERARDRSLLMVAMALDLAVGGHKYHPRPDSQSDRDANAKWADAVIAKLDLLPYGEIVAALEEVNRPIDLEAEAGKS